MCFMQRHCVLRLATMMHTMPAQGMSRTQACALKQVAGKKQAEPPLIAAGFITSS